MSWGNAVAALLALPPVQKLIGDLVDELAGQPVVIVQQKKKKKKKGREYVIDGDYPVPRELHNWYNKPGKRWE